jgi:transposase-like protein
MRGFTTMKCATCSATMVLVQRRGSSEGRWICPVCASTRRPTQSTDQYHDQDAQVGKQANGKTHGMSH